MLPHADARCALCHRPEAQWPVCTSPVCDLSEAGGPFKPLSALLRPRPIVGSRCAMKFGVTTVEGVIVAKCKTSKGDSAFVELDDIGDTVVVPVGELQVLA